MRLLSKLGYLLPVIFYLLVDKIFMFSIIEI
nr:MAG TPA: hypothetical protein [Caudoviricetes sp.]